MVKKSKSFIACLLAVLMILTTVPLSFASGEGDMFTYYYKDGGSQLGKHYQISGCNTTASGEVVIPSKAATAEHGELPVKQINSRAFNNCKDIESIVIPEGIVIIRSRAFINCTGLKSIYVPRSANNIDPEAFKSQDNATSGNLSVTLFVYEGSYAETFAKGNGMTYEIICEHKGVDEKVGAKEATCSTEGYTGDKVCKNCGKILEKGTTIEKLPHTYGDWAVTKEATCVAKGEERRACENCEAFETREIEVNPTAHNPEKIIIKDAKDATCKELGYTGDKYCSDCNNLVQMGEYIPTIPHTEEVIPAVAATCTETGLTEGKKCSVCGETLVAQETVPAKGHTPGEAVRENIVDSTCSKKGSYDSVVYCTVCENELSRKEETIEKKEHTLGDWVTIKPATCKEDGEKQRGCTKCTYTEKETILASTIPHKYNDGEITIPATCTEKGVKTFTCTVCGVEKTEEVEKIAHKCKLVLNGNKKDSTCAEEGYIEEDLKCTGCGEVFNTIKLTVAKKAHTPGEAVKKNEVAATCSTEGSYDSVVYCTVCEGEISREKVTTEKDPNNHTFSAWHTEKASTCKTNGVIVKKCTGCGKTETGPLELDPNNHTYDDGNVTTAPTCIKAGIKTFTCTECGAQKTEEVPIDPDAHTPGEAKEENRVEATCTANGSYNLVVRCKDCGSIISSESETINKLPHTYGDWTVTKEATCVAKGEERRDCENCEDFETKEIEVNPDAHNLGEAKEENIVAATCSKEGSYNLVVRCEYCNKIISSESKTIEKLSHTEEVIPAVAATCTKTGLTEGKKCSVCGETLVAQETVPVKEHTPGEAVRENIVDSTCLKEGSYDSVVYCTVCEGEISREKVTIEKDPNNHVNGYETRNEKEATCKEKGYTGDLCCVDCGAILEKGEETHINRANHAGETEIKNAKKATCTADGYTGDVYCLDCGVRIKKGETVKAKGHTDEDKDGRCDVCEAEYYTHETCPCRCHKSGFDKFLFKLMLFFQMLFEKNKVCKCGDLHY